MLFGKENERNDGDDDSSFIGGFKHGIEDGFKDGSIRGDTSCSLLMEVNLCRHRPEKSSIFVMRIM